MKVLALDIGDVRIGVAVGDTAVGIAHARPFVRHDRDAIRTICDVVATERVERIVAGRPVHLSGRESAQTAETDRSIERLRRALPEIPIELVDERFSSVLAGANLRAAAVRGPDRRALIDGEAARILLQEWLDRL